MNGDEGVKTNEDDGYDDQSVNKDNDRTNTNRHKQTQADTLGTY